MLLNSFLASIGEGLYRKLENVWRRQRRYSYEGEERSRELDKPRGSFSIDRVEQLREVGLAYEVELLLRSSFEASFQPL